MISSLISAVAFVALTVPVVGMIVLGTLILVLPRMEEHRIHQLVGGSLLVGLVASLATAALLPFADGSTEFDIANLMVVGEFHLDLGLALDPASMVMLVLDYLLCGAVGLFSARYLHRQPGYSRFYLQLMLFAVGVSLIAVARGLDFLFIGWELVGLSSALLIAYFHARPAPTQHGLRAYAVYRFTDIGLLLAVILLHHERGNTDLHALVASPPTGAIAIATGALIILGAMGKGASVPFTGWLPRAMEGPTPSSAIFYGALSIHASPFLLLRAQPLLDAHPYLRYAVIAIGAITAFHASMVGRTLSDIKGSLGYASVAQVGVIWIWAGLGWETVALVHIAGHAVLRMFQLLRAPSLLSDRRALEAKLGRNKMHAGGLEALLPLGLRRRLYAFALERWFLDELLAAVIGVIAAPFRVLDRCDARWSAALNGGDAAEEESP